MSVRPLSKRARALVEHVRALAFVPQVGREEAEAIGDVLGALASGGEWPALPHVVALAFSTETYVANAASPPIAALADQVPVGALLELDCALRRGVWLAHFFGSAWWELHPGRLPRSTPDDPSFAPLLRLAMSHPNGRVRETAVRFAVEHGSPRDLPHLLLRTSDWVPEVRAAALAAARSYLRPWHADAVINVLPLVRQLRQRARVDRALLEALDEVLATPECAAALSGATRSRDEAVRLAAFRHVLGAAGPRDRALFVTALTDRHAAVRLEATRRLRELGGTLLQELGPILRGDALGRLRALGLELLPAGAPVHVEDYLADRSGRVRHIAQRLVKDRGDDLHARTRDIVRKSEGRALASALEALADVARPADAELVRFYLDDKSPRVRAASLRCLAGGRREPNPAPDLVEKCLAALIDPAPRVTRAAADLLTRFPPSVEAVDRVLAGVKTDHGKKQAFRVLARAEFWRQLPAILRAPPSPHLMAALAVWIGRRNREKTPPTAKERADARAALSHAKLDALARAAVRQILEAS